MQERRSNADRRQETRAALLGAARALFTETGYAETGTPEIVARAGVTRGALYHHFADKRALFQALIEAEAQAIAAGIDAASLDASDPLTALRQGARAYFAAMQAPGRVRLMLIDGPAVLGPDEMRRIDAATGGATLREGLAALPGVTATGTELEALADLVSAMFDRAALAGAEGGDAGPHAAMIDSLLARLA
ncbi:TetR/AcrR family transcriptional regulator [Pararhodobacter aggregans]|uniref:TetR family transcriptional regulator n=1 Tax=Pararhodobacter aggregans TaxID=404875 RepID=A0A2T7UUB4_9RHOB|nr:TetR/AcrR family transcriptional regulator [Pararhodobacter aggregans]PTX02947.1 TetR family transcriptional regulator [Pararhodobacter aggregans]PVE48159.1 TetR family transcriptional regulator [Pararhodobacter aggregans]